MSLGRPMRDRWTKASPPWHRRSSARKGGVPRRPREPSHAAASERLGPITRLIGLVVLRRVGRSTGVARFARLVRLRLPRIAWHDPVCFLVRNRMERRAAAGGMRLAMLLGFAARRRRCGFRFAHDRLLCGSSLCAICAQRSCRVLEATSTEWRFFMRKKTPIRFDRGSISVGKNVLYIFLIVELTISLPGAQENKSRQFSLERQHKALKALLEAD